MPVLSILVLLTANVTVRLPVPADPDWIVIHVAVEAAVHAHVFPVETLIVPLPPSAENDCSVGEIE